MFLKCIFALILLSTPSEGALRQPIQSLGSSTTRHRLLTAARAQFSSNPPDYRNASNSYQKAFPLQNFMSNDVTLREYSKDLFQTVIAHAHSERFDLAIQILDYLKKLNLLKDEELKHLTHLLIDLRMPGGYSHYLKTTAHIRGTMEWLNEQLISFENRYLAENSQVKIPSVGLSDPLFEQMIRDILKRAEHPLELVHCYERIQNNRLKRLFLQELSWSSGYVSEDSLYLEALTHIRSQANASASDHLWENLQGFAQIGILDRNSEPSQMLEFLRSAPTAQVNQKIVHLFQSSITRMRGSLSSTLPTKLLMECLTRLESFYRAVPSADTLPRKSSLKRHLLQTLLSKDDLTRDQAAQLFSTHGMSILSTLDHLYFHDVLKSFRKIPKEQLFEGKAADLFIRLTYHFTKKLLQEKGELGDFPNRLEHLVFHPSGLISQSKKEKCIQLLTLIYQQDEENTQPLYDLLEKIKNAEELDHFTQLEKILSQESLTEESFALLEKIMRNYFYWDSEARVMKLKSHFPTCLLLKIMDQLNHNSVSYKGIKEFRTETFRAFVTGRDLSTQEAELIFQQMRPMDFLTSSADDQMLWMLDSFLKIPKEVHSVENGIDSLVEWAYFLGSRLTERNDLLADRLFHFISSTQPLFNQDRAKAPHQRNLNHLMLREKCLELLMKWSSRDHWKMQQLRNHLSDLSTVIELKEPLLVEEFDKLRKESFRQMTEDLVSGIHSETERIAQAEEETGIYRAADDALNQLVELNEMSKSEASRSRATLLSLYFIRVNRTKLLEDALHLVSKSQIPYIAQNLNLDQLINTLNRPMRSWNSSEGHFSLRIHFENKLFGSPGRDGVLPVDRLENIHLSFVEAFELARSQVHKDQSDFSELVKFFTLLTEDGCFDHLVRSFQNYTLDIRNQLNVQLKLAHATREFAVTIDPKMPKVSVDISIVKDLFEPLWRKYAVDGMQNEDTQVDAIQYIDRSIRRKYDLDLIGYHSKAQDELKRFVYERWKITFDS